MESETPDLPGMSPADQLDQLEQVSVDATIAALPVPSWIWPTIAVLASVFALGHALGENWRLPLVAVAVVALLAISMYLARLHGVVNDPRTQPGRLTRLQLRYVVEVLVLATAMILFAKFVNRWLAVVLSGPLYGVISYLHDQRYETATAAMRAARR